ncbi:cation efflux family protein [Artemisia annua]|uniref:Cation efflux family protein n=1 Tax=Artemisia annua TaxID=35608 RepID=A0A2U1KAB5_ARTAN|nr:cation efflux family protein [Artemisia annua]
MRLFRLLNTIHLHKSSPKTNPIIKSSYNLIPQLHDNRCTSITINNPNFNIYKRSHVGHSHINHHDETSKEGERIFRLGLAADIGLTVGKAVTGYLSGSTAIIADAAHSLSDVIGVGFERGQDHGSLTVAREHGSVAAPVKSAPSDL